MRVRVQSAWMACLSAGRSGAAPPQFHLDYPLTRNEWKRKENAKGPRSSQESAQAGRQALALYELNCPARKSFMMRLCENYCQ